MLMKLTLSINFINILRATFFANILAQKISKLNIIREKQLNLLLYKKRAAKMLMKLTLSINFITNLF